MNKLINPNTLEKRRFVKTTTGVRITYYAFVTPSHKGGKRLTYRRAPTLPGLPRKRLADLLDTYPYLSQLSAQVQIPADELRTILNTYQLPFAEKIENENNA
jgi:hypothetical protein